MLATSFAEAAGVSGQNCHLNRTQTARGGFLSIFWDVARANIYALEDIGAVVDWLPSPEREHSVSSWVPLT